MRFLITLLYPGFTKCLYSSITKGFCAAHTILGILLHFLVLNDFFLSKCRRSQSTLRVRHNPNADNVQYLHGRPVAGWNRYTRSALTLPFLSVWVFAKMELVAGGPQRHTIQSSTIVGIPQLSLDEMKHSRPPFSHQDKRRFSANRTGQENNNNQ